MTKSDPTSQKSVSAQAMRNLSNAVLINLFQKYESDRISQD